MPSIYVRENYTFLEFFLADEDAQVPLRRTYSESDLIIKENKRSSQSLSETTESLGSNIDDSSQSLFEIAEDLGSNAGPKYEVAMQEQCKCGHVFEPNSAYCRMCGTCRCGTTSIRKTQPPKLRGGTTAEAAGDEGPLTERRLSKNQRRRLTRLYETWKDKITADPHSFDPTTFPWPDLNPKFRDKFIVLMSQKKAEVLSGEVDRDARTASSSSKAANDSDSALARVAVTTIVSPKPMLSGEDSLSIQPERESCRER